MRSFVSGRLCRHLATAIVVLVLAAGLRGSALADDSTPTAEDYYSLGYQAFMSDNFPDVVSYFSSYLASAAGHLGDDPSKTNAVTDALTNAALHIRYDERNLTSYKSAYEGLQGLVQNQCPAQSDAAARLAPSILNVSFLSYINLPPPTAQATASAGSGALGAAQPASYPLVCQGGGNMNFQLQAWPGGTKKAEMLIGFEKAGYGFGESGEYRYYLAPGQCTWLDRPLNEAEPTTILFSQAPAQSSALSIQWWANGAVQIGGGPDFVQALGQGEGSYAAVEVYNDGNGHMVVTGGATVP